MDEKGNLRVVEVLPRFSALWDNYPQGAPDEVKRSIGGNVDREWIKNTCAIRMSRALNYSGMPVDPYFRTNWAVSGADGKWYAYRVRDIVEYLAMCIGMPAVVVKKNAGAGGVPSEFRGRKGIIAFKVTEWSDATGHVDMWDGSQCRSAEYFDQAVEISLWPFSEDRRSVRIEEMRIEVVCYAVNMIGDIQPDVGSAMLLGAEHWDQIHDVKCYGGFGTGQVRGGCEVMLTGPDAVNVRLEFSDQVVELKNGAGYSFDQYTPQHIKWTTWANNSLWPLDDNHILLRCFYRNVPL